MVNTLTMTYKTFYEFCYSMLIINAGLKHVQMMAKNGPVRMKFVFMEVKYGQTKHASKNTVAKCKQLKTMQIDEAQRNAILGIELIQVKLIHIKLKSRENHIKDTP